MNRTGPGWLRTPERWVMTVCAGGSALAAGVLIGLGGNRLFYATILCLMVVAFCLPRLGVVMTLFIAILEGYARNKLANPQVLLIKDLVLAAVYLRFFGERLFRGQHLLPSTPLGVGAALFVGTVLVQTLNPHQISPQVALVGVRTWIFYIPLFYVGWELFGMAPWRGRLTALLIIAAVPVCLLGITQLAAGPAAYSSQGYAFQDATFVTGVGPTSATLFRPNSTFASPAQFATFIALMTLLCLGVTLSSHGLRRMLVLSVLALLIALNVIESQRTFWILLPPLMLLAVGLTGALHRSGRVVIGLAASLPVLVFVASYSPYGESALVRVSDLFLGPASADFADRVKGYLYFVQAAVSGSPIGLGAGASTGGSRYVTEGTTIFLELSLARVIADLSLLGLAFYLIMLGSLLRATFLVTVQARRAAVYSVAASGAALLAMELLILFWGYETGIGAVLFWLIAGAGLSASRELSYAPDSSQVDSTESDHDHTSLTRAPLATS